MRGTDACDRYILIVEDSPEDFEIMTRSLRKAGVMSPVYHCQDGDETMEFLTDVTGRIKDMGYPSLILLDLNMPGIDGREILGILKQTDSVRNIPVIVLSTSNNERDIEACYLKGANSYVKKPISPDDFARMIQALKVFWFDWAVLPGEDICLES